MKDTITLLYSLLPLCLWIYIPLSFSCVVSYPNANWMSNPAQLEFPFLDESFQSE